MPQEIKIISSRRAYEFRQDELRLTVLSIAPLVERIRQVFGFQSAQVGTPAPTFGEVAFTLPPGLVFNTGSVVDETHGIIPIRFLNFEQRRIVLDVAAPSAGLTVVYDALRTLLAELPAADGNPALGVPYRTLDASEISAKLDFSHLALVPPALTHLFKEAIGLSGEDQALIPTLTFQLKSNSEEYAGTDLATQVNGPMLQLALRQGTRVEEQVFFSTAPLASEAHIVYLERLEESMMAAKSDQLANTRKPKRNASASRGS